MQTQNEKTLIRNAMIILCVALIIVYVALYQIKGDDLKERINTPERTWATQELQITESVSNTSIAGMLEPEPETEQTQNQTPTNPQEQFAWTTIGNPDREEQTQDTWNTVDIWSQNTIISWSDDLPSNMRILSGTSLYFGPIAAIDELNIPYTYALQDSRGVFYLNLGNQDIDIAGIARVFDGNIYVMNTAQEIINNVLFGDKVTFINIPKHRESLVLFIVELWDQRRLIHINYAIYHESKRYLQSLFIE